MDDFKPVDWTKPLWTRDGRKVVFVARRGCLKYPRIARIEGGGTLYYFTESGRFSANGGNDEWDLFNVDPAEGEKEVSDYKPVDWDKPLRTRDGREVKYVEMNERGIRYTRVALVDDKFTTYTEEGRYITSDTSVLDLFNVEPEEGEEEMPKEIPDWAKKRAGELVRGGTYKDALARYISEHEQPPIDPDLLAVREILKGVYKDTGIHESFIEGLEAGLDDDSLAGAAALAAYKAGKAAKGE